MSILTWTAPLTLNEALAATVGDPDFVIGPLQPGDIGILSGGDGSGKSLISLMMAASVAYGISAGGVVDKPRAAGRVLIVAGEDRRDDHIRRLKSLGAHLRKEHGIGSDDDGMIALLPLAGRRIPLFAPLPGGYAVTDEGEAFANTIKQGGWRLVIIDPLRMFHDITETDGPGMDALARWLVTIAMVAGCAIIVVHHASQDAILNGRTDHHAGRGATDFPAACRAGWVLRKMTEKEASEAGINADDRRDWRLLVNAKANHGREDGGRWLQRRGGLWLRSTYTPGEMADAAKTAGVAHNGKKGKGKGYDSAAY
jgi:RecA-family ATPase